MRRVLVAIALLGAVCGKTDAGESLTIVENGVPRATISIPLSASEQIAQAADLLSEYVEKSTGARLPVEEDGSRDDSTIVIHVGEDDFVRDLELDVGDLDVDGFVIAFPGESDIVIVGPTDWGTEFGVCEFLERYLDIRWLMPGEVGEDVPLRHTIAVPTDEVRDRPAIMSRGLMRPNGDTWARRNRHHGWLHHGHNLQQIFPPDDYRATHPEFFPILNGERYLPRTSTDGFSWQPCFTAEGIVREGGANIGHFFEEHPEQHSYSLCMNDNNHFCEGPRCRLVDGQFDNSIGWTDHSNSYFAWANDVIARVLDEHPDRWFTTYAYMGLYDPPRGVDRIHPRMVTFITYGRSRWADPELEARGHAVHQAWRAKGSAIGWYDYSYGTPYVLPRVWFHQMGENIRYGHEHDLRGYFAESCYNWGEGPKLYLTLRLLWDPSLDVDEVLDEWYVRTVGETAAPELAAYYAHWEDFWTNRVLQSSFVTGESVWGGMWLPFAKVDYLDVVEEEDLARSRTWLEAVVAKAGTPPQKARARILLRAFEYYQTSALTLMDEMVASRERLETESAALDLMGRAERYMNLKEKRFRLVDEFSDDPILRDTLREDGLIFRDVVGDRWGCYPLWRSYEWVRQSGRVRSFLEELAHSPVADVRSHARLMRTVIEGEAAPVSDNATFDTSLDGWFVAPVEGGSAAWDHGEGHGESGALRLSGLAVLEQTVPVGQSRYTALGFVKIPPGQQSESGVELTLTFHNVKRQLTNYYTKIIRPEPGVWMPLAVTFDVVSEEQSNRNPRYHMERDRRTMVVRLEARDFSQSDILYVDDLALYVHEP